MTRMVQCIIFSACALAACAGDAPQASSDGLLGDTIHVASPSGEEALDRASILDALQRADSGDTVLFAPGLYRLGPMIRVDADDVTLQGHPEGTVLRGCDPERFTGDPTIDGFRCHGIELAGARQTVRDLTIEYAWHGIYVGCCFPSNMEEFESGATEMWDQAGGHRIENNTFRYSPNGLRVIGEHAAPVLVEGNTFVDVYHAIGINGGPVHFVDNDLRVERPHLVPVTHHPGDAINVLPFSGRAYDRDDHTSCRGNVIRDNRIEGYPEAIAIQVWTDRESCRGNEIVGNLIVAARTPYTRPEMLNIVEPADSTFSGVPIRLLNLAEGDPDALSQNLVEGNRIVDAYGVAITLLGSARNRVVDNVIVDVRARRPFPGNTISPEADWAHANGSAIWVSDGSPGNVVRGNRFEGIEGFWLVLEGDSTEVDPMIPEGRVLVRDPRD